VAIAADLWDIEIDVLEVLFWELHSKVVDEFNEAVPVFGQQNEVKTCFSKLLGYFSAKIFASACDKSIWLCAIFFVEVDFAEEEGSEDEFGETD